jgi:hypothetical protein
MELGKIIGLRIFNELVNSVDGTLCNLATNEIISDCHVKSICNIDLQIRWPISYLINMHLYHKLYEHRKKY